jgi:AraC family transcriptional regulator of arabinose operon
MIFWGEPYRTHTGIIVSKAGHDVTHAAPFCIDRPAGFGDDFIFLNFTTAITIADAGGKRVAGPGACMLYAPGHAHWYCAADRQFTHHWFHATGARMARLVRESGMPVNRVLYPARTDIIGPAITAVCQELSTRQRFWDRVIAANIEQCLLIVGRSCTENATRPGPRPARYDALVNLRAEIYARPEDEWDLAAMARTACLSISRFSYLYRQYFSVSPVEDVISARMQRAQWLLANTDHPIKTVAAKSGFEDPAYFSRLFSHRMGISPRRYAHKAGK